MKVEISVPTSLNEVTVEQYQRFAAIDQNADPDFLARKMLEIFCGVTDTLKVKKKSVDAVFKTLQSVFNQRYPHIPIFKLEGIEYGFIPNLEEITFGEYIDLDHFGGVDKLHQFLAVLYRPVTERYKDKYKIEQYESSSKYSEIMKKAPASVAIGAMVFFWTLSNDLARASLTSLKNKAKETTAPTASTQPSTAGSLHYTLSQMATLQKKAKLQDYQLASAFMTYLSENQNKEPKLRSLIAEN